MEDETTAYDANDNVDGTATPKHTHVWLVGADNPFTVTPSVSIQDGTDADDKLTVNEDGSVNVNATIKGPSTPVSGVKTEVDGNVHPFAAVSTPCGAGIYIVANASNDSIGVLVGGAAPAYPLYPGQSVKVAVDDLQNIYYQFQHPGDTIYFIQGM
jgi:hypothetical protein